MEGWAEWRRRPRIAARHSRIKVARPPAQNDDDEEFYAVVYVTAPSPAAARKRDGGDDDYPWLLPAAIGLGGVLITMLAFSAGWLSRGRHDAT
jgi:hypothetical protein